jgi:hypothetical protein
MIDLDSATTADGLKQFLPLIVHQALKSNRYLFACTAGWLAMAQRDNSIGYTLAQCSYLQRLSLSNGRHANIHLGAAAYRYWGSRTVAL